MALSKEAAEALIAGYLDGRELPPSVHQAVISTARARLIDGDVPVLDIMLCRVIDRGAEAFVGVGPANAERFREAKSD